LYCVADSQAGEGSAAAAEWIPYALWLSKTRAALIEIRFGCGSSEVQMLDHLMAFCGISNLRKAEFKFLPCCTGKWPLLGQTEVNAWNAREKYLHANFPCHLSIPGASEQPLFPKLIELATSFEVMQQSRTELSVSELPVLEKLSICLPKGEDPAYHSAISWINALPSLKVLLVQGGYAAKFVFGRSDSPLEVLDVTGGAKALRIAQLTCPQLRQIRMSPNAIFGAGMWAVGAGDLGEVFQFWVHGNGVGKFVPYHRQAAEPLLGIISGVQVLAPVAGCFVQDGYRCVPVNAIPEGLRWGYVISLCGDIYSRKASSVLSVPAHCVVAFPEADCDSRW